MTPQVTNRREGGLTSCFHFERARDRESGSETAWCADYWQGKCPGRGVAVEGV
jgi:hypothetical protein